MADFMWLTGPTVFANWPSMENGKRLLIPGLSQ